MFEDLRFFFYQNINFRWNTLKKDKDLFINNIQITETRS